MEVLPGEMIGMSLTDSALEKRSCVQLASDPDESFRKESDGHSGQVAGASVFFFKAELGGGCFSYKAVDQR